MCFPSPAYSCCREQRGGAGLFSKAINTRTNKKAAPCLRLPFPSREPRSKERGFVSACIMRHNDSNCQPHPLLLLTKGNRTSGDPGETRTRDMWIRSHCSIHLSYGVLHLLRSRRTTRIHTLGRIHFLANNSTHRRYHGMTKFVRLRKCTYFLPLVRLTRPN